MVQPLQRRERKRGATSAYCLGRAGFQLTTVYDASGWGLKAALGPLRAPPGCQLDFQSRSHRHCTESTWPKAYIYDAILY